MLIAWLCGVVVALSAWGSPVVRATGQEQSRQGLDDAVLVIPNELGLVVLNAFPENWDWEQRAAALETKKEELRKLDARRYARALAKMYEDHHKEERKVRKKMKVRFDPGSATHRAAGTASIQPGKYQLLT